MKTDIKNSVVPKAVCPTVLAALFGLSLMTSTPVKADDTKDLQPFNADTSASSSAALQPFTADSGVNTSVTVTNAQLARARAASSSKATVPAQGPAVTQSVRPDTSANSTQPAATAAQPVQSLAQSGLTSGPLPSVLTGLDSFNNQAEDRLNQFAAATQGQGKGTINPASVNTDGLVHSQIGSQGAKVDQFYNPVTKSLSLVLNGRLVTINNGDYAVVVGTDGKRYRVFNPGSGNAAVQEIPAPDDQPTSGGYDSVAKTNQGVAILSLIRMHPSRTS
ncbi:hypothetical protein OZX65_00210 [Leuconostocaceae bacterium ESL0723]|nr:hypothetical protein OZX65_00210 [Leuconostocaceae bacterium ESL0723]